MAVKFAMEFDPTSVRIVVDRIKRVARSKSFAEAGAQVGGDVLFKAVQKNISIQDHSLRDLQELGHPYARRRGSIAIHPEKPYLVHSHSRRLLQSLSLRTTPNKDVELYFNTAIAPHAIYVTMGTKVLIPRAVLSQTAMEPGVQKDILVAVGKELVRVMINTFRGN